MPLALPLPQSSLFDILGQVVVSTVAGFRAGNMLQEPQFTERLLTRLEVAFNQIDFPNVKLIAVTFTDRGPGSEEKRYGADYAGLLSINAPDTRIRKLILVQAKMGEMQQGEVTLSHLPNAETTRLVDQLENMVQHTKESYLCIYTNETIVMAPAISIFNIHDTTDPKTYWNHIAQRVSLLPLPIFYQQYFNCWVGDLDVETRVGFTMDSGNDVRRAMVVLNAAAAQLIRADFSQPLGLPA